MVVMDSMGDIVGNWGFGFVFGFGAWGILRNRGMGVVSFCLLGVLGVVFACEGFQG